MKKGILWIAAALAFSFAGSQIQEAQAVSLNVSGGLLLGASEVDVLGTSYDVTFVDGSCVDLYSGCDEAADFDFTDSTSALAAAQALLDDVFLDSAEGLFDTHPELTAGCESAQTCFTLIPYDPSVGATFNGASARNGASTPNDAASLGSGGPNRFTDWSLNGSVNFARFTPTGTVPEPPTFFLLGSGLIGLMAYKKRSRKQIS